jgi:glycosyltransferase involved in cell wall biosynthesis
MRIIGYGICGAGEADRYLKGTLDCFKKLCDDTIILLNNAGQKEKDLIASYGFKTVEDNREWGTNQHLLKQDFMNEVKKLQPDYCVCLDMDEVFDTEMTREDLEKEFDIGDALYCYIVNLWEEGWNKQWSFFNIRAWKWSDDLKFENKPLHCGLAPAWCYRYASYSKYFVKHYGLMTKESRQAKIARYEKYDPRAKYKDESYYKALHSDKFIELNEVQLRKDLIQEIGVQKKRKQTNIIKEYYYVRSPQGKEMDIPAKDLDETLRRGFTLIGKVGSSLIKKPSYKIVYIGNFKNLWDEEYIARSFEDLGHNVIRIHEKDSVNYIAQTITSAKPDFVIFAKLRVGNAEWLLNELRVRGIKTICWLFDLYWGYVREEQIKTLPCFKAQIVCTTDGGNDEKWEQMKIKHFTVRQGIYKPECFMLSEPKEHDLVFVGTFNPANVERNIVLDKLSEDFNLTWIGKRDANEMRGTALNNLYAKTKVVIGDSVISPKYWSNRIVETLGRGGFLIHKEVEGLKEEYPYLVTYTDYEDLKAKIEYYIKHNKEREEIVKKNFEWVRDNYTCEKKCDEIIKIYEGNHNK